MKYTVVKEMVFVRHGKTKEMIRIPVGVVVNGVHHSQMSHDDKSAFRKMEQRLRKDKPTKRYGYFRYEGQIRAALVMDELKVTA